MAEHPPLLICRHAIQTSEFFKNSEVSCQSNESRTPCLLAFPHVPERFFLEGKVANSVSHLQKVKRIALNRILPDFFGPIPAEQFCPLRIDLPHLWHFHPNSASKSHIWGVA